jgi:hypothetical protein
MPRYLCATGGPSERGGELPVAGADADRAVLRAEEGEGEVVIAVIPIISARPLLFFYFVRPVCFFFR